MWNFYNIILKLWVFFFFLLISLAQKGITLFLSYHFLIIHEVRQFCYVYYWSFFSELSICAFYPFIFTTVFSIFHILRMPTTFPLYLLEIFIFCSLFFALSFCWKLFWLFKYFLKRDIVKNVLFDHNNEATERAADDFNVFLWLRDAIRKTIEGKKWCRVSQ